MFFSAELLLFEYSLLFIYKIYVHIFNNKLFIFLNLFYFKKKQMNLIAIFFGVLIASILRETNKKFSI